MTQKAATMSASAEPVSADAYRALHEIKLAVIGEEENEGAKDGDQPGEAAAAATPSGGGDEDDASDAKEGAAEDNARWQPVQRFGDAPFHPRLLQELRHAAFKAPTPIQAQCWPIACEGRDIVAIAKTGSGKTLGYLLPIFHRALTDKAGAAAAKAANAPFAIILAPTRELVLQIHEQAAQFGHSAGVSSTCVYGGSGAPRHSQLPQLLAGESTSNECPPHHAFRGYL